MAHSLTADRVEAIEQEATTAKIEDIASYLQGHLGQRITAYLSGIKDHKEVGAWASGEVAPRFPAENKMRHAYRAARMIVDCYGDATAKAWFFGTNTRLKDQAPAYVLRRSRTPEDLHDVVPVARAFAAAVD